MRGSTILSLARVFRSSAGDIVNRGQWDAPEMMASACVRLAMEVDSNLALAAPQVSDSFLWRSAWCARRFDTDNISGKEIPNFIASCCRCGVVDQNYAFGERTASESVCFPRVTVRVKDRVFDLIQRSSILELGASIWTVVSSLPHQSAPSRQMYGGR